MNRSTRVPVYPRHAVERRRAVAGGILAACTVIAFYVVPILLMALCIQLGWYAEPTA